MPKNTGTTTATTRVQIAKVIHLEIQPMPKDTATTRVQRAKEVMHLVQQEIQGTRPLARRWAMDMEGMVDMVGMVDMEDTMDTMGSEPVSLPLSNRLQKN